MTRDMAMAYVKARADFTDAELLFRAHAWHTVNEQLAWQYREAWAIRCVEGKEMGDAQTSA